MSCEFVSIDNTNHLKCGEFLFVDKLLDFEDSVELCKSQNHQFAVVNIKVGEVNGSKYKNATSLSDRAGSKFGNKSCVRFGQMTDGKKYGQISGGKIKLSDESGGCYEVIANASDLESAFRPRCGGIYFFLCRTPRSAATVSSTDSPTAKPRPSYSSYSSEVLNKKNFYAASESKTGSANTSTNTKTSKSSNVSNADGGTGVSANNNSSLIGMSIALCFLFIVVLLLMTHICYKNGNKRNNKKNKKKLLKVRYSPADNRLLDDVTAKKNDVTPAVKRAEVDAASLPTSCDVYNDDLTPNKVASTTNDVTTNAQLYKNVASLPISCDICCNDVIAARYGRDVSELKEINNKDSVGSVENNKDSDHEDFSFWVHVSES